MSHDDSPSVASGSEANKVLFCRTLLDTFDPYEPEAWTWPSLDEEARARLVGLPIWDMAVETEAWASLRVKTFAATLGDPLLREAVELDAFEEGRHERVLRALARAYGIPLRDPPRLDPPRDPEGAFLRTGYAECIDTFFAFGLVEHARRTGFFPPALVERFEPVIQEEARHILFFVNWVAWRRRTMPWWRRPRFELKVAAVWLGLLWDRLRLARGAAAEVDDSNFTLAGASSLGAPVRAGDLLRLCLAEDERRLGRYDARLLRPRLVPAIVRLICRFLPAVDEPPGERHAPPARAA